MQVSGYIQHALVSVVSEVTWRLVYVVRAQSSLRVGEHPHPLVHVAPRVIGLNIISIIAVRTEPNDRHRLAQLLCPALWLDIPGPAPELEGLVYLTMTASFCLPGTCRGSTSRKYPSCMLLLEQKSRSNVGENKVTGYGQSSVLLISRHQSSWFVDLSFGFL